jgi:hypothetical protein
VQSLPVMVDGSKDYYSVLGVIPTAELIVIRAAYRVLAGRYHPDVWKGKNSSIAEIKMREINEAHDILSNEEKRKQYDRLRANKEEAYAAASEAAPAERHTNGAEEDNSTGPGVQGSNSTKSSFVTPHTKGPSLKWFLAIPIVGCVIVFFSIGSAPGPPSTPNRPSPSPSQSLPHPTPPLPQPPERVDPRFTVEEGDAALDTAVALLNRSEFAQSAALAQKALYIYSSLPNKDETFIKKRLATVNGIIGVSIRDDPGRACKHLKDARGLYLEVGNAGMVAQAENGMRMQGCLQSSPSDRHFCPYPSAQAGWWCPVGQRCTSAGGCTG